MSTSAPASRSRQIDEIAALLPRRTGQFSRVMARLGGGDLPRGMASMLASLEEGPLRITTLARREHLAQPTTSRMVERLERKGLVDRGRDAGDGRIVLVTITDAGRGALHEIRRRYRAVLRKRLRTMSDEELRDLVHASRALQELLDRLQDLDR